MSEIKITLLAPQAQIVERLVESKDFASAQDVVDLALQEFNERRQRQIDRFNEEIKKGLESPIHKNFDVRSYINELMKHRSK